MSEIYPAGIQRTWVDLAKHGGISNAFVNYSRALLNVMDTAFLALNVAKIERKEMDLAPVYKALAVRVGSLSPQTRYPEDIWKAHSREVADFKEMINAAIADALRPEIPDFPPASVVVTPMSAKNNVSGASTSQQPIITSVIGADRWSSTSKNRQPLAGFEPGQTILLKPGNYQKFRVTRTYDIDKSRLSPKFLNADGSVKLGLYSDKILSSETEFGIDPITNIVSEVPGEAVIVGDPTVGGTDTLYIEWGGATAFRGIRFTGDDRAIIDTENMKQAHEWQEKRDIYFYDCMIDGGWDATKPVKTNKYGPVKWGGLSYGFGLSSYGPDTAGFQWIRTSASPFEWDAEGVWEEHLLGYFHNVRAITPDAMAIHIKGARGRWAGRTGVQVVSRVTEMHPTGTWPSFMPYNEGCGTILIENCYIEDVCLQDGGGGSAVTIAGNHNGKLHLKNTEIQLGCNPNLAIRRDNITGCFVSHAGDGSEGRPTREIVLENCRFIVGLALPGAGSARRPNVNVANCGHFRLLGGEIRQGPGTREALFLDLTTIGQLTLDSRAVVIGDCGISHRVLPDLPATETFFRGEAAYAQLLDMLDGRPGVTIL